MSTPTPAGLSSNLEDYLETIWFILQEQAGAHAADIAQRLGVTRASVTGALRSLAQKGLIDYEPYKAITLTPEGANLAERVAGRHRVLKQFFMDILGVPENQAESTACGMEHQANDLVIQRLVEFTRWLEARDLPALGWDPRPKDSARR